MDKDAIRKQMSSQRKALSSGWRKQASNEIFRKVKELVSKDSNLFVYVAVGNEVETNAFMEEYPSVSVPRCHSGGRMEAVTGYTAFEKTPFGTMEPTDGQAMEHIDAAIIPGLAFSNRMDRIGYGAGYYDRFLKKYPHIKKIAVCFDFQVRDDFEADEHDVKMDYIVTDKRIIKGERIR